MKELKNLNGDNWDDHWVSHSDAASLNPAQKFRFQFISNILAMKSINKDAGRIVDLGCGSGDLLRYFSSLKFGATLMGIEPSTEGCSIAKSKNPNAMIIQADIIHDDRFDEILRTADAVVCTEVLEHLDNPEQLIFKVSQVINDNGLFIVSVPGGPRSAFDKYIGHRRHFSRTRLRKMLTTNGFSDVEVMAAGFPGFNIYKICVMLLGRRLIVDSQSIARSGSATFASNIFGKLMSRSLTNSIFGWQLFAIARR